MDCPLCKDPMIVFELQSVELDHCLVCGGVWLDAGELELLLKSAARRKEFLDSFHDGVHHGEAKRRCPICFKKMDKVLCGREEKSCCVDRCPKGHGLWLDAGELETILSSAGLKAAQGVSGLLTEVFHGKLKHKGGSV